MPDAVMIFAAGRGTRMAPLTDTRPKPLIEVGGIPLIDHALALADAAQIKRRVVNIHHLGTQVKVHLANRPDIRISDESDALLETGGGLRKALPLLGDGPVFTLNSDAVWTDPGALTQLRAAWRPEDMGALLLLLPRDRAHGYTGPGNFALDPAGRLSRPGPWIYSGAQIVDTEGLSQIAEDAFSLNLLWAHYAEKGRLFGIVYPGHWADVGTPKGIAVAEILLQSRS
jgi:MurNAc alpha-1-phosphate uridylyltransferase